MLLSCCSYEGIYNPKHKNLNHINLKPLKTLENKNYVEWYTTSKPKYDSPTTTQTIMTWCPLRH
jgi:hypothetical protein